MNTRLTLAALALSAIALPGCKSTERSRWDLRTEGEIQMAGQNYAAAADRFAAYLQIEPGNHEVRYLYGKALTQLGRYTEASEALLTAYSQRPGRSDYADAMVDAMIKAGKKDELFRILRSNANDRNNVEDWLRLGRASQQMGDTDTAQTALLTAARVDKGRAAEPQLALAQLYRTLGRNPDAERRLRMAYYMAPNSTAVLQLAREMGIQLNPGDGIFPEEAVPRG